ncbi:MAG: tetratricopeptide repeat protein [Dolichospermum sp. WA123]|nr:tetratricopeptide repeat protein [Dolichospermum sp. WA123]
MNLAVFGAEQEEILAILESSTKSESPGIFKAGNPHKSLAYWQGREEEIAKLKQWLNDPNIPLIGIEGIGGIGKSMLSAYIYEDETIAGFTKRFWADVSSGAIFTDVATQVLQDFGFRVPEQETQLVQTLVKCLQSDEYLLIIDNLESLLQTDGIWGSQFYEEFFTTWVECGGKSKVIVTTRERPELPKRWEWLPLSGLKIEDGIKLLTALGIQGNLHEFVKLVDGYPLLLRFVADLLKEEYPQDPNLKRLESLGLGNLQQLLTDKKVVGSHRRENVAMVLVLDTSFGRLSELQKSLLQNISVFRGSVNSQAAVAVCLGSSETEIERELRNLVKRSFLSEKLIDDGRWFEFQPVVLEYVQYKAGDQTEAHQKAINYYLLNVKQKPWHTKDDIQEYLEIFYHWYQLENYDSAFDILEACNNFLTLRGYYNNQVDLYEKLIAGWEKTGERGNWKYLASLISLGNVYKDLGEYQQAIKFHRQSLEVSREIGDPYAEISSLIGLGSSYYLLKEYQRAIKFHRQSLNIAREIGARKQEGSSLMGLGNVYDSLGKFQQAIEFYQLSLDIAREIADCNNEAKSLMNLGAAYSDQGQFLKVLQAIAFYQESLAIARDIGDVRREADVWFNLGLALEKVDREEDALGAYRNARELFQIMGLDTYVQDCNERIESLSQPKKPVVSQRGFWGWLRRLWLWLRGWFRR